MYLALRYSSNSITEEDDSRKEKSTLNCYIATEPVGNIVCIINTENNSYFDTRKLYIIAIITHYTWR